MNATKTTIAALITAAVAGAFSGCSQGSERPEARYYAAPQYNAPQYAQAAPVYQPAPPTVTYTPQPQAQVYPQQPAYQVYPNQPAPQPAAVYQEAPQPVVLNQQQLDQLVGPVALYPDPLLSEVLAAATYPQDVTAAQQWLQANPTPYEEQISAQPWDASVKALVHYPTVLATMANQPAWTATLGAAFATQQQDVMDTVQRLRVEAQNARTLASNPQQVVVTDNNAIEILPAQPDVIYVPVYDPAVVYVATPGYDDSSYVTYTDGYAGGVWLDLDCDWHDRQMRQGVRWNDDWRRPDVGQGRQWQRDASRPVPRPRFEVDNSHGAPARGDARPMAHAKVPTFDTRLVVRTPVNGGRNAVVRPAPVQRPARDARPAAQGVSANRTEQRVQTPAEQNPRVERPAQRPRNERLFRSAMQRRPGSSQRRAR